MAFWSKRPRKREPQPTLENTSNTHPQKQRKSFPAEVKLLEVKALEAGLIAGEVSQDRGRGQLLGDGLGESVPGGGCGVSGRQVRERHDPADLREAGAEDD